MKEKRPCYRSEILLLRVLPFCFQEIRNCAMQCNVFFTDQQWFETILEDIVVKNFCTGTDDLQTKMSPITEGQSQSSEDQSQVIHDDDRVVTPGGDTLGLVLPSRGTPHPDQELSHDLQQLDVVCD